MAFYACKCITIYGFCVYNFFNNYKYTVSTFLQSTEDIYTHHPLAGISTLQPVSSLEKFYLNPNNAEIQSSGVT